jgi:hypothetical protein
MSGEVGLRASPTGEERQESGHDRHRGASLRRGASAARRQSEADHEQRGQQRHDAARCADAHDIRRVDRQGSEGTAQRAERENRPEPAPADEPFQRRGGGSENHAVREDMRQTRVQERRGEQPPPLALFPDAEAEVPAETHERHQARGALIGGRERKFQFATINDGEQREQQVGEKRRPRGRPRRGGHQDPQCE